MQLQENTGQRRSHFGEAFPRQPVIGWMESTRRWVWPIVILAAIGAVIGLFIGFTSESMYRSEVTVIATNDEEDASVASLLPTDVSGFASLAGLGGSAATDTRTIALATLGSRAFISNFVCKHDLMDALFPESEGGDSVTLEDAYLQFKRNVLSVREDRRTGIITISVHWGDPDTAASWANLLVSDLNAQMRSDAIAESERRTEFLNEQLSSTGVMGVQQSIHRLIEKEVRRAMLANVRPEFAFRVIDPAAPSDLDRPVRPQKLLILILAVFFALVLGVLAAYLIENVIKNRHAPQ